MSLLKDLYDISAAQTAVIHNEKSYTYAQLIEDVKDLANWFIERSIKSVCINLSNSYEWIVADLACQEAGVVCTPVPQFFSAQQIKHLIEQTLPDVTFTNALNECDRIETVSNIGLKAHFHYSAQTAAVPLNTAKITFTSGSTGQPKGVCLSIENQLRVAKSLVEVIGVQQAKHLVLLPFATLLENIAGIYAPLLSNGQVIIPSDEQKGFSGSRLVDLNSLLSCISQHSPSTMILVPELLQVLVIACKNGWKAPSSLSFIAVGGAKVDASLIEAARQYDLPVFQGYGLSECASVVSICTHFNEPSGSVGKALPHTKITEVDGELIVSGNSFLGYLGEPDSWYPKSVNTGDMASIKGDYIFINGRSKNLIINSFGRNISPEWVESKLSVTGLFMQNMVVGDAKPYLCGLLVPAATNITNQNIEDAIVSVNRDLPDYAKVMTYVVLPSAFTLANGFLTENGKLRRSVIEHYYADQINQLYTHQASIAV
jgi:long-subunit acyl-CoA synthetase (AMP-forming)